MKTKDLFSTQATLYSQYRPSYPDALFKDLAALCSNHDLAWDAGTGNGQAALALTPYFKKIFATDFSEKQIKEATPHPQVEFKVGTSDHAALPDHSVDLITVAQAFHWFHQERFFSEVKRVAKKDAILALWCYEISEITPEADTLVSQFYQGVLGSYWDPERKLVEEGYRNEKVPFQEITFPKLKLEAHWSLEHFIGYLKTWSAYQKYLKANSDDPILALHESLTRVWPKLEPRLIQWPLSVRCFRVK